MAVDTSLAPSPHEHRDSKEHDTPRMSRKQVIAAIAAVATTLTAAGVLIYRGITGDEPERTGATPAASADRTPGTETPSPDASPTPNARPTDLPSTAPTEQLSAAERQKEVFMRASLPETVISNEFLEEHVDESSLDLYRGVNGGEGLYPQIDDVVRNMTSEFGQLTPDDIVANLAEMDRVLNGNYTTIVDGKPVTKTAETFFTGAIGFPQSHKDLEALMDQAPDEESKSWALAAQLASAGNSPMMNGIVDALKSEQLVEEYNLANPDALAPPSSISALGIAQTGFVKHEQVSVSDVEQEVGLARSIIVGETEADQIDYQTARLLKAYIYDTKAADGETNTVFQGATILYETTNNGRKTVIVNLGFVPAERVMVQTSTDGTGKIIPGKDQFYVRVISKQVLPIN